MCGEIGEVGGLKDLEWETLKHEVHDYYFKS